MIQLSSSSCGTAPFQSHCAPESLKAARGQRSITSCRRSALVIENHDSLMIYFLRVLKDKGYAVRTAADADEGLRLYRECGPFGVVVVNYCLSDSLHLALAIRDVNSSQKMIIAAFDYRNEEEVSRPRELMDAQLLLDTRNFQLRSLLERIEVDRAIEELTTADLQKLQWSANFRIRGLGRAASGRTGSDLLGEALRSTLEGTRRSGEGRRWNKDVDFVTHLTGAMRSIASSWKRQFDDIYLESEVLVCDIEGHKTSPFEHVPSNEPTPDRRVIEMENEMRIIGLFANDSHATCVVRGFLQGLKKSEIMQKYGLIEKQYTAAVKRIRLKLYGRKKD